MTTFDHGGPYAARALDAGQAAGPPDVFVLVLAEREGGLARHPATNREMLAGLHLRAFHRADAEAIKPHIAGQVVFGTAPEAARYLAGSIGHRVGPGCWKFARDVVAAADLMDPELRDDPALAPVLATARATVAAHDAARAARPPIVLTGYR